MDTPSPSALPPGPADRASPLSLRRVAIDTYRENVAYLNRNCAVYRAEGFQALSKIEVRANGRRILATLIRLPTAQRGGAKRVTGPDLRKT